MFNEANTVEAFIRDRLCGGVTHYTAGRPRSCSAQWSSFGAWLAFSLAAEFTTSVP